MYLIDTNIHAAYLLQNFEEDNLTKQYLKLYNEIRLIDRVVPDFILGEFETFIMQVVPSRYKLNAKDKNKLKQLVLEYMQRLTNEYTIIVPTVEIVKRAKDIFFENAKARYVSFVDSLMLATAEETNYTLFTKDNRMSIIAEKLKIPLYKPQ